MTMPSAGPGGNHHQNETWGVETTAMELVCPDSTWDDMRPLPGCIPAPEATWERPVGRGY